MASLAGSADHAQRWKISSLEKQLAELRTQLTNANKETEDARTQVSTVMPPVTARSVVSRRCGCPTCSIAARGGLGNRLATSRWIVHLA